MMVDAWWTGLDWTMMVSPEFVWGKCNRPKSTRVVDDVRQLGHNDEEE